MPEYTLEQKAAAFDHLWNNCGSARGILFDWTTRDISRPGCPPNEATVIRIPRYKYIIAYEGDSYMFRDVLHKLATS